VFEDASFDVTQGTVRVTLAYAQSGSPMGKVISLDKYREAKAKAKAEASKQAEPNRRPHGRTKAERERDERKKHSDQAPEPSDDP
jgi:hypothetical protein